MSLIKLQGNASGTGAFTIAAPNGNTDRTLTLPDATGTVTVAPAGAVNFTAAPSGAMTLDASGNLGLGTTSPNEKVTIASSNSASYVQICDSSTGTTSGDGLFLGSFNGAAELKTKENNILAFGTNNTERARIDASGNLLVGTTNSAIGTATGFRIVDAGSRVEAASSASTNAAVGYHMWSTGAGAYRFYVGYGGTIFATSTSISAISDASLKENIRDLETGLDTVMALRPRRFDWKNGDGQNVAGFIAQEVEAVLPELVYDYQYTAGETKKSLKMGDMLPTAIKAIQELKAELDAAKARIAALEGATE